MTECRNWNLGNVKAAIGGSVDWCVFKTWEVVHGVKKDEVLAFRSFASLEEGAAFYIGFLAAHEPDAWPAVLSGDPDAFAHGLKLDRYYTADEAEYAAGVRSRLHFYWTHLVQALLAGAGYPVKVDGFAGPQTSLAVVHFQGANGLPGTGVADDATVAALERAQVVPAPDTIPDVA
jgi:peptidoglycan hydrolase-like protein with peptidoglycan-binding domain